MKVSCLLAITVLSGGCAPMSEQQYEWREYRQIDRINSFLEYEHNCHLAGGLVHIQRRGGDVHRTGFPGRGDQYWCGNRDGT